MKTPYAILIGLALIAAAVFYRETPIRLAQATTYSDQSSMVEGIFTALSCPSARGDCHIAYGDYFYSIPQNEDNPKVRKVKYR